MSKERVLGYDVYLGQVRELLDDIVDDLESGNKGSSLACFNPHSYAIARRDRVFARALSSAHYLIPDGIGVVLASRFLKGDIRQRITGFDLFDGLHKKIRDRGTTSVFFLGSTEDTLSKIVNKMESDFPNIKIAGTYSPPFKAQFSDLEVEEMVATVNSVAPDILWVGMTAPKQEKWVADVIDRVNVGFTASIGAVFDFYVGNIKRSPVVFQRLGLEWLPRLFQEPRRLWRRIFISAPIFLWHVLLARLGKRA